MNIITKIQLWTIAAPAFWPLILTAVLMHREPMVWITRYLELIVAPISTRNRMSARFLVEKLARCQMSPLSSVKIQRKIAGYQLRKSMAMFPVRQRAIRLDVARSQSTIKLSQKLISNAKVISAKVVFFELVFGTYNIQ